MKIRFLALIALVFIMANACTMGVGEAEGAADDQGDGYIDNDTEPVNDTAETITDGTEGISYDTIEGTGTEEPADTARADPMY